MAVGATNAPPLWCDASSDAMTRVLRTAPTCGPALHGFARWCLAWKCISCHAKLPIFRFMNGQPYKEPKTFAEREPSAVHCAAHSPIPDESGAWCWCGQPSLPSRSQASTSALRTEYIPTTEPRSHVLQC